MERKGLKPATVHCAVFLLWIILAFSLVDHSFAQNSSRHNEEKSMEKGMNFLFVMTKEFLQIIQPHRLYEKYDVYKLSNDIAYRNDQMNDISKILLYFIGFAVCIAIGAVFIVIVPVIGCCLCCCRCCNRCGGMHKKYDPKNARFKRRSYITCLVILNTVILFAVVCSFVTNELYKKSFIDKKGFLKDVSKSSKTLGSYLDGSFKSLQSITKDQINKLKTDVMGEVNSIGNDTTDLLDNNVNVSALLNKVELFGHEINELRVSVNNLSISLDKLTVLGETLSSNLTVVKNKILEDLNSTCKQKPCDEIKNYVQNTKTIANFSKLDDQKAMLKNFDKSLNISHLADEAKRKFHSIRNNITSVINTNNDKINQYFDNATKNLDIQMEKIGDVRKQIPLKDFDRIIGDAEKFQEDNVQYMNIPWYIGLSAASILLLIVIFNYLGILFGLCGERNSENSGCCSKNVAANFLLAGVGFFFLFSWILMLLVIIYFMLGGALYTEGCRYIDRSHPQYLQPFLSYFNYTYKYENHSFNIAPARTLENCGKNYSLMNSLEIDLNFIISSVDMKEVDKKIKDLSNQNIKIDNISLMTPDLLKKLQFFQDPKNVHINISQYETELGKQIIGNDLSVLASNLSSMNMANASYTLHQIINGTYAPMVQEKEQLKIYLEDVRKKMNFSDNVENLIRDINETEIQINNNGSKIISSLLKTVVDNIIVQLHKSLNQTIRKVSQDVGHCRPLYNTVYDLTDIVCVTFLNPLNGFWFSLGWAVIFFLPTIIFATKLASLYRCQYKRELIHDLSLGKSDSQGIPKSSYGDTPSNKYQPLPHPQYHYGGPPMNQVSHYPVYPPPSYPETRMHPGRY
ncbi:prominin-1-A-like isoform X4 [Argonauta hians]